MKVAKGIYRHYKGNLYQVLDIVTHSETLEEMVLYKPLNQEEKLWVRPVKMFLETVIKEDKEVLRFTYLSEN